MKEDERCYMIRTHRRVPPVYFWSIVALAVLVSVEALLVEGFTYYYGTTHTVLQQQIQTNKILNSLQLNANNDDDDETEVRHQL